MSEYAWVRTGDGREVYRRIDHDPPPARSRLPMPSLITDQIEVKSMVDGNIYTSKAALRRSYRAHGYTEVGNEELKPTPKPVPDRKAVRHSIRKAFSQVGIPT